MVSKGIREMTFRHDVILIFRKQATRYTEKMKVALKDTVGD